MARTGDMEAFENLYILTVEDIYQKALDVSEESADAGNLVRKVYLSLYCQVHTLPLEEEDLMARLEEEIYRQVEKIPREERKKIEKEEMQLSESQAATLWLQIEEELEQGRDLLEENSETMLSHLLSGVRVFVTLFFLVLTVAVLFLGWNLFLKKQNTEETGETVQEEEQTSAVILTEEQGDPVFQQGPDGNLYLENPDGTPYRGERAVGKQLLAFSKEGELTLIRTNPAVNRDPDLSFDGEICFEVKEGNIYKIDSDGEETLVVRNGHVMQADVRCGFLWYICQYQIPNTTQIKTSICRALPDGQQEEELYTTDQTLEIEGFQITSDWMYYLSDGKLFRKSLEDGKTEYLAEEVEFYFAWEDTAYYMKDRTLEQVSEGEPYEGIEAGFQLEQTDQGYILLDAAGELALEGESGEIQIGDRLYQLENGQILQVSPAVRQAQDIVYYLDGPPSERKIYWKNQSGTSGLIPQEGLTADCFCIAGTWLYYSARTAQYGGECESRIYRVNIETMEEEPVGEAFRGFLKNLYYFEGVRAIYGEYISSTAIPTDIHGSIVQVGRDRMDILQDTDERPEGTDSDMLELVMADSNLVYCLYHRLSYDSVSGSFTWKSSMPLELKAGKKAGPSDDIQEE